MSVNVFAAASRICERGEWRVTNLELQKILYVTHMVQIGETGRPLINSHFEAWDYGPVCPELYHRVKIFGGGWIKDIFWDKLSNEAEEASIIDEACKFLIGKQPAKLVAMTHWNNGAWAKNYVAGARGIRIPDKDIIAEYKARIAA